MFRRLLPLSITVLTCVITNCTRSGSNHNSNLKSNDGKLDSQCDACAADLFNMKHAGDRNVIYALTSQYFYFVKEIKPFW